MNITLIGYRGSGKTTIGKLLAQKLWMDFVDTDALLAQRAGQSIKEIFATQGEAAFRDLEAAVVTDAAARDNLVIATGGGVVLREANVAALKKSGKVIYLYAPAETLLERIGADPATAATRPALTAAGGTLAEIRAVLTVREPLYQAAADVTLEVTRLTPEAAAQYLLRYL